MKILHIADFGRSGNINGVGEAVLNLAENQKRLGMDVMVVYTRPNQYLKNNICILVESINKFGKLINQFLPDIVILHSFYDFKHPKFAKIVSTFGIPYLITYHGGALKTNYKKKTLLKFIANALIFKRYIKGASATVYLNVGEKENSIFTSIDYNKSLILPNGIIIPNIQHKYETGKDITITFLSRLDYRGKGLDILLPAIKVIESEIKKHNVCFKFYGFDYKDGTVERITANGTLCKYCGYVLKEKKNQALLKSDIMILPSRSEGMPVSILEALSYGIPCIVTPQTNVADIIENHQCGWVTNLTITEVSTTILRAVNDLIVNHKTLSDNALRAAKEYSWEEVSKKSITIYKGILEK